MADYDVGVIGLSVPPASAAIQQYRPSVSVRNNGIHPALATGYVRIYSDSKQIANLEVFSGTIDPGQTREAQSVGYWTPPAVGRYLINGYVTCDRDQVENNNNLPPTWIEVTNATPPPSHEVALHAAQHEEGGADELNIDGLQGRTADPQFPTKHGNDEHDDTYIDQLAADNTVNAHDLNPTAHAANTGLERTARRGAANGYAPLGTDSKVPTENLPPLGSVAHHATHENNGTDEISVSGLSGLLADPQTPTAHAANHGLLGSDPLLSAEFTARKGATNGYAGLDSETKVPAVNLGGANSPTGSFLANDRTWKVPTGMAPAAHHASHEKDGADQISINGLSGRAADAQPPLAHVANHQAGGIDLLSVAGLHGVLADKQDPSGHKESHQNGGSDKISIAGLSGLAADAQTPKNHGATHQNNGGDDISIGGLSGIPAAAGVALGLATLDSLGKLTQLQIPAGLQSTSEKGAANGYAPLDATSKVPTGNLPSSFLSKMYVLATDVTQHVVTGNTTLTVFDFSIANLLAAGDHIIFRLAGSLVRPTGSAALTFLVRRTHLALNYDTATCTVQIPPDPSTYGFNHEIRLACRAASIIGFANFFSNLRGFVTDANTYPWTPSDDDHLKLMVVNSAGTTVNVELAQVHIEKLQ